jgi:hypothetical protein
MSKIIKLFKRKIYKISEKINKYHMAISSWAAIGIVSVRYAHIYSLYIQTLSPSIALLFIYDCILNNTIYILYIYIYCKREREGEREERKRKGGR